MAKTGKKGARSLTSTESYLLNEFNNIYNSYTNLQVDNQIAGLKYMVNYIKESIQSGMKPDEIEYSIGDYVQSLVESIENTSINDFYRLKTIQYVHTEKINIDKYLKNIINRENEKKANQRANQKIKFGAGDKSYSADINKNIESLLYELIDFIAYFENSTTDNDLIDICKKIKNNSLTETDIPLLRKYVKLAIQDLIIGKNNNFKSIMKKNSEIVVNKLIKKAHIIFDVQKSEKRPVNFQIGSNNIPDFSTFQQSVSPYTFNSVNCIGQSDTVRLKTFLKNPFISDDIDNNIMIHIYEMLQALSAHELNSWYQLVKSARRNPQDKECLIKKINFFGYSENCLGLETNLRARINDLICFFQETGELDSFNTLNNQRLDLIQLGGLTLSTDEIKKMLRKSELSSNRVSTEMLTAMAAFYTNRLSKVYNRYAMAEFIFSQKDIINKLYENPELEFYELGISRDDIKEYMAKSDLLQKLTVQTLKKQLTQDEFDKVGSDYGESLNFDIRKFSTKLAEYGPSYQNQFGGDFAKDIVFSYKNYKLERRMYCLKDYAISSLVYMAVMDKQNEVINWGYISEKKSEKSYEDKILLGFDIRGLNIPVTFHVKRKKLNELIKILTGSCLIPVYEGVQDLFVIPGEQYYSEKKFLSAQVVYPMNSEQYVFLKNEGTGRFRDHLFWMQNPASDRPKRIAEPGSRLYNIETGKIISKKALQDPDDLDDPFNK